MKATPTKFKTVDEYISTFPDNIKGMLEKLRNTIKKAAPKAEEVISYNMPAFKLQGMLVFYAAYKNHIGFYPTAMPIEVFKDDLVNYKTSKGAIQFPIDKPLPLSLIMNIVRFKVNNNLEIATMKTAIKKVRKVK